MWLTKILHLKPAKWPVGRSIRMTLGVGIPLAIGLLSNNMLTYLWVTLGVMMQSAGESNGSYRSLFRVTLIASLIGALGFFAGNLWHLPGPIAIGILTLASFIAGIINSYGAAYSKGTLQALLIAALAFGLAPELHGVIVYWHAALLYLTGAIFYLFLLSIEALVDKNRPQRQLLAEYLTALAALAKASSASKSAFEEARSRVIDIYETLYSVLIDSRSANVVRSKESDNNAAILQAGDSVFSALIAHPNPNDLSDINSWLTQLAEAVRHNRPLPTQPDHLLTTDRIVTRINNLITTIQLLNVVSSHASNSINVWKKHTLSLEHLIVGHEVIKAAAILALCMGVAYSMKYVVHGNHWYWIPLTVSLVMKPELGSVFVRAVLRFAGTAIGVLIGAFILMLVPKGYGLLFILMALASCLPWAMLRSYALQTLFLTPLVLILIDLTSPETSNVDYAGQRLIDTAIGGGIVLVFGYFIWPRSHEKQLANAYKAAMNTIAAYFRAACLADQESTLTVRRDIYSQLSNLRSQLQRQLSEPSPADREALKWFPIIAGAERLTDCITIYAENRVESEPLPSQEKIEKLALYMQSIFDNPQPLNESSHTSNLTPDEVFLDKVISELDAIFRLIYTTSFPLSTPLIKKET